MGNKSTQTTTRPVAQKTKGASPLAFGVFVDDENEEKTATRHRILTLISSRRVLFVIPVFSFVLVTILTIMVFREVQLLRSEDSTTAQWEIAQAEVEFKSFQSELHLSSMSADRSVKPVTRAFDIFYSRIDSISVGSLFSSQRENERFKSRLNEIQTYLNETAEIIDGPVNLFREKMRIMQFQAHALSPTVHELVTLGTHHAYRQAEEQRNEISRTLNILAFTTVFLLASMGLLAFFLEYLRLKSERQRENLLQAGMRINAMMSTSLDPIIITDLRGHVIEFNKAAEETFQYDRDSAIGRSVGDLLIPQVGKQSSHTRLRNFRNSSVFKLANQGRVRLEAARASGEVFPIELALQRSEINGTTYFIAFIRDISFRLKAEEDLIKARDQALQSEKAKSRFLAIMSHEIRTPMNGVLGNLSLLRDTHLTDEQLTLVQTMETSGQLLTDHVNDVLDIARFDDGKLTIRRRPTNLRQIVKMAIDSQAQHADARGNHLTTNWIGAIPDWVNTDPGRVQQILINLLSNAIKFTEKGLITVELEAKPDGRSFFIRVIDTGMGIPEDAQRRVFEDFVTQDSSYGRMAEGTGLGLGIVRRITQTLDGEIGLKSKLNEGSTFWVKLPLEEAKAPEETKRTGTPIAPAGGAVLDILVVEDNPINRNVVRAMLQREGHKVSEATDGQSGVQLASAQKFDLILMDISMPIMDGRAATRAIRSGGGASVDTPVVALTAHVLPENIAEFVKDGMQDVLPKPLKREDLQRITQSFASENIADRDTAKGKPQSAENAPLIDDDINLFLRESVGMAYDALLTTLEADLKELKSWLEKEQQDLPSIALKCHKQASSAAVFGAARLQRHLIDMQTAAQNGDKMLLGLRREMLPQLLQKTLDALRASHQDAA